MRFLARKRKILHASLSGGASLSYADLIVADGASNYWRLDEPSGTTAVDSVGGKNGTISGGVTLDQTGPIPDGKAMMFDGTTGKITLPSHTLPAVCSVEAWVKANPRNFHVIWTNRTTAISGNSYLMAQTIVVGKPQFRCGPSASADADPSISVVDGHWHHVVGVSTASATQVFVDGVASVPVIPGEATTGSGYIGNDDFGGFFTGSIAEVALYPLALTPEQIAAHYALRPLPVTYQEYVIFDGAIAYWPLDDPSGTSARDIAGTKHGTISGGVTLDQSGVADSKAMLFDAVGEKIITPAVTFASANSVELWIKPTSSDQRRFFSLRPDTAYIFDRLATGELSIYSGAFNTSVRTLSQNVWHHVVVTHESSNYKIYLDGILDSTFARAFTPGSYPVNLAYDSPDAAQFWHGLMQDVAIYDRALTLAEILAHYQIRVPPSPLLTDLVSYWPLSEASGTRNDSHGTNHLTDVNSVSSAEGRADFERDSSQALICADNATLSVPNSVSFTLGVWVKAEVFPTGSAYIIAKDEDGTGIPEFVMYYVNIQRFRFSMRAASGGANKTITANSFGVPTAGTLYFICAWFDVDLGTVNIQINNGTVDSVGSWPLGTFDGVGTFRIGSEGFSGSIGWDGLIGPVGFWKRVLTTDERTELYNSGTPLSYPFS